MELDVTAYSKLKLVTPGFVEKQMEDDEEWSPWDEGFIHGVAYDSFPESTRGLHGHDQPTPSYAGFIGTGWYQTTYGTEQHNFRAGSYGGYGAWRADLAEFAMSHITIPEGNPDKLRVPFIELTHFADNEGCIGPEAARDLLADFRTLRAAYRTAHPDAYDNERYDDWERACQLAADGGLIDFH